MHLRGPDVKEVFPSFSFETSVLKLLLEALEYNGKKVAQIEAETGKSCSFADILQWSKSIAAGLSRAGVGEGDFVVICCNKSSLAYSLKLGVMFTGATPVMINAQLSGEIHKHAVGNVKAVFCEKTNLHLVNESVGQMSPEPTLVATTDAEDTTLKLLLLSSDEFSLFEVKDITKHVPLVLFTSGSTGEPKGAQISDIGLQRLGYSFVDESIESYLVLNPLCWVGSTVALISSILKGYTLVLSEAREPAAHLQLIDKYKVNGWTETANKVNLYIKDPVLSSVDLSSLTLVNIGGGVFKRRVKEAFIREILKGRIGVHNIYGMTEVGLITTWRNKDLLDWSKSDSSGYLAPGVEVKILDDEGRLVTPGSLGGIWVKSVSMMVGYWNRPDLNKQMFGSDGFFRTGDAGYFDNDGFLYVTGRMSEHVNHGGTKIPVSEVEDMLKTHSDVVDATVVAEPHPTDSYRLIAFIVVKPGSHLREEDITLFIAEQAGESKRLKGGVYVVEELPKTQSGKVHKGLLHGMMHKLHKLI